MNPSERNDLAEERAELYAPKPTGGILLAGFCGAILALLADVSISGFYGWRVQEHLIITAAAMLLSWGGVAFAYARRGRHHRAAAQEERREIDRAEDAKKADPVAQDGP